MTDSSLPLLPTPSLPVQAVVFDLGGVLIDWNPRHLYRRMFDDEAEMERFLSEVCSLEWNLRQDAGRSWHEAVAELTARHPEQAALIAAYHQRWEEMLGGELPETVALLQELHGLKARGLRLYALTNWSHETFPIARRRFAFLECFDGILVSGEEQMVKPDPAIFQLLLARYDIAPSQAVFIDDSPRNVAAAAAFGLHALRFTDAQRLRRDLLGLGLPLRHRPGLGED